VSSGGRLQEFLKNVVSSSILLTLKPRRCSYETYINNYLTVKLQIEYHSYVSSVPPHGFAK
jgi:hypothetical protein